MNVRGFLKCDNSYYPLCPKVTTVGQDGCHLIVPDQYSDPQHAIIEFCDTDQIFTLKDLDSSQGTYVNGCRVQNAAVHLHPGDIIKFGMNAPSYEFVIEGVKQPQYFTNNGLPPRSGYQTQSGNIISADSRALSQQGIYQTTRSLTHRTGSTPHLAWSCNTMGGVPASSSATNMGSFITTPGSQTVQHLPRNSNVGSTTHRLGRPLSAGSAKRSIVMTNNTSIPVQTAKGGYIQGGWISGKSQGAQDHSSFQESSMLQEKEQRIANLEREIERLHQVESEMAQRDDAINQYKMRVDELESQLSNMFDPDLRTRLMRLEQEVTNKKEEVESLRQQLAQTSVSSHSHPSENSLRKEISDLQAQNIELQSQLDKSLKDQQITSGLVTQFHRDVSSKDSTVARLTREIETLRKDMNEKDVTISAMQAKFSRLKENKKAEEEREVQEKDLLSTRAKLKTLEVKVQEQNSLIKKLQEDLEGCRVQEFKARETIHKLRAELDESKSMYEDMVRTERVARVDMQEATKKYERMRNRVMQILFSTPGVRAPDSEIKDEQLIEMLRKVVDERSEFHKEITEMKDSIQKSESLKEELGNAVEKLNNYMRHALERLTKSGRIESILRDEVTLLSSEPVHESLYPIKEGILSDLRHQHQWQQDIDKALEEAGANPRLSTESTSSHIRKMFSEWQETSDDLRSKLTNTENQLKEELEIMEKNMKETAEENLRNELFRERQEAQERQITAIEEALTQERENYEAEKQSSSQIIEELTKNLEEVKVSLQQRQTERKEVSDELQSLSDQLKESQIREQELRDQLADTEKARDEAIASIAEQVKWAEEKQSKTIEEMKLINQQHSVTICKLEERLNKVISKNKELSNESNNNKQIISGYQMDELHQNQSNEVPDFKKQLEQQSMTDTKLHGPAVKVTPDLATLERNIVALRQENAALKKDKLEHDDIVESLRLDLAGATARLGDLKSELTEAQKEEVDALKFSLKDAEFNLSEERGRMVLMLETVTNLKNDLSEKENDILKLRQVTTKLRATLVDRDARIVELEEQISSEREKWASQLSKLEDEGAITNELCALGAQCRGERHEQIIQHQKEALGELRKKLKLLEQLKSPDSPLQKLYGNKAMPSHDQAIQQVILLKKELAELRAKLAIQENHAVAPQLAAMRSQPNRIDNQPTSYAKVAGADNYASGGQMNQYGAQTNQLNAFDEQDDMMKDSALKEALECLEVSEATYMSLLRQLSSSLDMEAIPGMRTISQLPRDGREKLRDEREAGANTLLQRIRVLKERLTRKEELLLGYEQDLAKLKQAEELAARKDSQVESLIRDLRMKTEETELLRESLNRTKEMLNHEKRLNTSIKQKKPLHEPDSAKPKIKPKYHCPPEDIFGKELSKQRDVKEKLKRKDYEIKSLKSELSTREKELCTATTRMTNLEQSLKLVDRGGLSDRKD